ncbi:hypothetical protein ACFFU1_14645 [Algibacter miyuki]|uniref:Phage protein n=1 Tax=Algibacter miyuki TaxID=1306933 RepID=A0ABV5H2L4_9FLAO|nr:hypothetical protein [Algibacter miyuki]MDN3665763.1 hypothetical protein [Algibacter miyuki]
MADKTTVVPFRDKTPQDRNLDYKVTSYYSKVEQIANFSFPFINQEHYEGITDDLTEATEMLIEEANRYLIYLKNIKFIDK